MTNVISKLHGAIETWSFKYNCYEAVHPWTPFCSDGALDLGLTVFGEAIKLYTPLYLFSQIAQKKYDAESFIGTSQSIIRSSAFISTNAFFALLFFCSSQYVTGKFYYYAVAYIPAFLASSMAVLIERPHRRSSLAFYVANVASEALFRIYVARGYIRPIRNGQVYIFAVAMAIIMMLAKKRGFENDPLSAAIKLIVGPEEALIKVRHKKVNFHDESSTVEDSETSHQIEDHGDASDPLSRLYRLKDWLKFLLTARHTLCPHKDCSCLHYVFKASGRALLLGYGAQLALKLGPRAPALIKNPSLIRRYATDRGVLSMGLFLSTFTALFKATNCCLRWSLETCKPANNFIAGLLAGPALLIYPSPTVALYVLWKCLEVLFNEGVRTGLIRNKNLYIVILYGLATSQLFYSAMLDPRYMKKGYMSFLDKMSHHKLHMVNRSVLDVFGTEASSGYEEFFPDLHPNFISRPFMSSIWIWMIEQKIIAKHLVSE